MWISNIENNEGLKNIYKEEPSLLNLYLHEFSVLTGEDIRVIIKFDLGDRPKELPSKWRINKVNTIQLVFEFIRVDLNNLVITNNNFRKGKMIINENKNKHIIFIDDKESEVFNLKAKWIFLKNIFGYHKNYIK